MRRTGLVLAGVLVVAGVLLVGTAAVGAEDGTGTDTMADGTETMTGGNGTMGDDPSDDGSMTDGNGTMDDGSTDESDMDPETESTADETMADGATESDGQPGFGVAVAVVALLAAGAVALRRRR